MGSVPSLEQIRSRILSHRPRLARPGDGQFEAAVALILHERPEGGAELLFIERAVREGDPWSGQMAFPGGRREPRDSHLAHTAARETREEVGIDLDEPIGRLDDFEGSRAAQPQKLVVAPFVYGVDERPGLRANHEVQSTVWVPMDVLLDPGHAVHYRFERDGFGGTFPAIEYRGYTIWGLTYRILTDFFALLGRRIASPDGA